MFFDFFFLSGNRPNNAPWPCGKSVSWTCFEPSSLQATAAPVMKSLFMHERWLGNPFALLPFKEPFSSCRTVFNSCPQIIINMVSPRAPVALASSVRMGFTTSTRSGELKAEVQQTVIIPRLTLRKTSELLPLSLGSKLEPKFWTRLWPLLVVMGRLYPVKTLMQLIVRCLQQQILYNLTCMKQFKNKAACNTFDWFDCWKFVCTVLIYMVSHLFCHPSNQSPPNAASHSCPL